MFHSTPPIQQNIAGTRQAHLTATRRFVLSCFVLFFLPQSLLLAKSTKCYFWGHNIQYNFANQIFPEFTYGLVILIPFVRENVAESSESSDMTVAVQLQLRCLT